MTPFADEQYIQSDMCGRGQQWQREILAKTVKMGTLYNAYNCPVRTLKNISWTDCFLGGLVGAGIPPQMADFGPMKPTPLDSRIRFWLLLSRAFGHATESSIHILHYADIFFIGFATGTGNFVFDGSGLHTQGVDDRSDMTTATAATADNSPTSSRVVGHSQQLNISFDPSLAFGLYSASTNHVHLPFTGSTDNATIAVFVPTTVPYGNISFGQPDEQGPVTFFGASQCQLLMQGGWWDFPTRHGHSSRAGGGTNVRVVRQFINGSTSTSLFFPAGGVVGPQSVALSFEVGTFVTLTKA
jgi:hypothetical protein